MLAMKSYEQNEGFSVMTADEMYFVNGGSMSNFTTGVVKTVGGVALMAGGLYTENPGALCGGTVITAYGIGRLTGAYSGPIGNDIRSAFEPAETGLAGLKS